MTPQEIADASPCFACWSPGEVQVGILTILALFNGVTAEELAAFSGCFACLTTGEVQTDKLVVLTVPDSLTPDQVTAMATCFDCWAPGDIQVGILTVMASNAGLTAAQITAASGCFACLSPGDVQVQILTALSLTDSLDPQEIASQAGCFDCWSPGQIQSGILGIMADSPVVPPITCTPVVITTGPLGDMTVGVVFSQQIEADGTGPITYAVLIGSLPAGLSLSAGGVISGTPTAPGSAYSFAVRGTNSCSQGDQTFSGTVCTPVVITTTTLGTITVGVPFAKAIAYTGTAPISLVVSSGALPAGLSLVGTTIGGSATTAGAYAFTLTASNECGSDPQAFSGTVTASCTAVVITNTTLSAMVFGVSFSDTIDTTGTLPQGFSVVAGALPNGLTLAGNTISGTPIESGPYSFTIRAINSCPSSDDQTYSGTVSVTCTTPFSVDSYSNTDDTASLNNPYSVVVGDPAFFTFSGDGILVLELTSTLPPGFFFDQATRTLYGSFSNPELYDDYPLTFNGSNGCGSEAVSTTFYLRQDPE